METIFKNLFLFSNVNSQNFKKKKMISIEKFKKIIVSSFHIYNTQAFHVIYFIMDKVEHVMSGTNPNPNPK